ncbi:MAG TPA: hypothetical protein VH877_14000 [Polyangia bacterium]|nr:hypothetical protein [Polyangia bacterium]
MRRIVLGLAYGLFSLIFLVVLAFGGTLLWLRSASGQAFVRRQIDRAASQSLNGRVEIGAMGGSILQGLLLHDVAVRDAHGDLVARARTVAVRYNPIDLLLGRRRIGRLGLVSPELRLVEDGHGRLNVSTLVRESEGPPTEITFSEVAIEDGRIHWQSRPAKAQAKNEARPGGNARRLESISARGQMHLGARRTIDLRTLTARYIGPEGERPLRMQGQARLTDDAVAVERATLDLGDSQLAGAATLAGRRLDLKIDRLTVAPGEARWVADKLDPAGPLRASGRITGPLDALAVNLTVQPVTGSLALSGRLDVTDQSGRVVADLKDVSWSALRRDALPFELSGRAHITGRLTKDGPRGTLDLAEVHGRAQYIPFSEGTATARIGPDRLQLERYTISLPGGTLVGDGLVREDGAVQLRFHLRVLDPEHLPRTTGWQQTLLSLAQPLTQGALLEGSLVRPAGGAPDVSIHFAGNLAGLGGIKAARSGRLPTDLPSAIEPLRKALERRFGRPSPR